jgi:hypothetical protein
MIRKAPRWAAALLLAAWLSTASPVRAADEPVTSSEDAAPAKANADDPTPAPQAGTPSATPNRPAAKPSEKPKAKSRPMQTFRPSEEIHVDKAVDFPADI